MKNTFKKIYNCIMYSSIFLALMGVYCKITLPIIKTDTVIVFFLLGLAISIIILQRLHSLFLQYLKK